MHRMPVKWKSLLNFDSMPALIQSAQFSSVQLVAVVKTFLMSSSPRISEKDRPVLDKVLHLLGYQPSGLLTRSFKRNSPIPACFVALADGDNLGLAAV
jgi:hypothetical protein